MKKHIVVIAFLIIGLTLACNGVYAEVGIRSVEQEEIDKVQTGYSAEKVRELLGEPHKIFSEEEMEKLLPEKREYTYKLGKKEAWFYANAAQSPKIIFDEESLESKVEINENSDIVYSLGNMTEAQKKHEGIYDITIEQVLGMQKTIQKSRGETPELDYFVVFVNGKVVEIVKRRY